MVSPVGHRPARGSTPERLGGWQCRSWRLPGEGWPADVAETGARGLTSSAQPGWPAGAGEGRTFTREQLAEAWGISE